MNASPQSTQGPDARERLLIAARDLIRRNGYSATSVAELCARAGVSKGAFFHHFDSKDALGCAAAQYWSETTGALFAGAAYHGHDDPADRVLAYIRFRRDLIGEAIPEWTCLVGTMVQEVYETAPALRKACADSIKEHAATLVPDIAAAMAMQGSRDMPFTAESLALHTQAVIQGAFILAKATGDANTARDSVDHLYRYVEFLLRPNQRETEDERTRTHT